jgi:hypothetical protein
VVGTDLLLDGLYKELRDLRGTQLVPGEGSFASLDEYCADGVGGAINGYAIWGRGCLLAESKQTRWMFPFCAYLRRSRRRQAVEAHRAACQRPLHPRVRHGPVLRPLRHARLLRGHHGGGCGTGSVLQVEVCFQMDGSFWTARVRRTWNLVQWSRRSSASSVRPWVEVGVVEVG